MRTKAFKEWFGDWEKDPANASKVVDENGEPLVLIHNSQTSGITEFKPNVGNAIFFADEVAQDFVEGFERGQYDYEVFLNIRNPHTESYEAAFIDSEDGVDGVFVSAETDSGVGHAAIVKDSGAIMLLRERKVGSMTKEESEAFLRNMEQQAEVAAEVELTPENWTSLFGEDGKVNTPIGEVKMGESQYFKLAQQGRNGKIGMVKPTLENPDVIIEEERPAKDGKQERPTSFIFVKAFTKEDGSRYYYFTSVTVRKDGHEVVISNQEKSGNRISRLLQQGNVTWTNPKFSSHPNARIEESVPVNDSNGSTDTDNQPAKLGINSSELSGGKGTENSGTNQGNGQKNALTEEEIDSADAPKQQKTLAKAYLRGNHGELQTAAYADIYEDVRGVPFKGEGAAQVAQPTEPANQQPAKPKNGKPAAPQGHQPQWEYEFHYDKNTGRAWITRNDVSGPIPIGDGRFRIEGRNLAERQYYSQYGTNAVKQPRCADTIHQRIYDGGHCVGLRSSQLTRGKTVCLIEYHHDTDNGSSRDQRTKEFPGFLLLRCRSEPVTNLQVGNE